jgi:hypothetical protein
MGVGGLQKSDFDGFGWDRFEAMKIESQALLPEFQRGVQVGHSNGYMVNLNG